MAYLYGASIQGIQEYIFETNKLKEIVGASDIIEWFCSLEFLNKFCRDDSCIKVDINSVLRNAGGNIRLLFKEDEKEHLEKLVKVLPKYIMQEAYGITVTQAVVEFKESDDYLKKVDELERKLIFVRNRTNYPLDAHFSILDQAKRTGKAKYRKDHDEYVDKGTWQKIESSNASWTGILLDKMLQTKKYNIHFTLEMDEIANSKNKIAVIHADGNNMGLKLQNMKNSLRGKDTKTIQKAYKFLSDEISKATNDAVKDAFEDVFKEDIKKSQKDTSHKIPFRPCIIGGDDLTVICNADKAVEFTKKYLENFENNTKNYLSELESKYNVNDFKDGLTACAGIAYCNKKFPFHYAVGLAEELCSYAKKASDRKASCLVFHNIQSSYYVDYNSFVKKELTTKEGYKLTLAPYYTKRRPKIDDFLEATKVFSKESIPLGKFREWVSEVNKNYEYSQLFMKRIVDVMDSKDVKSINNVLKNLYRYLCILDKNGSAKNPFIKRKNDKGDIEHLTPIYDIIQYIALKGATNEQ